MQLRLASLLALVPVATLAGAIPTRRQDIVPVQGSIAVPDSLDPIAPGAVFDFEFDSVNYCESGYEPVSVWVLAQPPSTTDITTDGVFAEGTYLYEFGEWLINNFGLPVMSPGPPPNNLTMPDFSQPDLGSLSLPNTTLYLAVIEKYSDCPGNVPAEYGVTSTSILYNATATS